MIRDGDVTMFESNAIVRYLSARFRPGLLRPDEHRQLAMAEQWMEWQQQAFAPAVVTLFINTSARCLRIEMRLQWLQPRSRQSTR